MGRPESPPSTRTLDVTAEAPPRDAGGGGRVGRWLTPVHPAAAAPVLLDGRPLALGREPGRRALALDDALVSRRHAELVWHPESGLYRLNDLGSRNGTFLDGSRIESGYLRPGAVLRVGGTLLVYSEVALEPGLPVRPPAAGRSAGLARAEALADRVAPTALPVLVTGPTGAGKERLARRVHDRSGRPGPLVVVDCGAISGELIASELFGHARGAFSGAHARRDGLFAAAEGGTLFFDEIGELPLDLQPALLRALQEGRIRPVGADRDVPVDVRVVAATHRDLEAMQAEGRFRADLYARLAGLTIELPGLADRREEVLPLFRAFLGPDAPPLTGDAAEALLLHDWPRNVRELKFVAERTRLFLDGVEAIEPAMLPASLRRASTAAATPAPAVVEARGRPDRETLETLLRVHGGNVAEVGRALGRHRQQVYRWLRAHGLDPKAYRPA